MNKKYEKRRYEKRRFEKKIYFTHYNLPPIWEESSARMIWWPWLKGRVVTWPVSGFISMVIGCAVRPCGRSWWVATSAKVCTAWVASCWPILGICDQKKKSQYIVNAVPLTAAFLLGKNFSNFVKWLTTTLTVKFMIDLVWHTWKYHSQILYR